MSHFATPFLVVNLGCEMIYIIEQRLRAQNIPADKAQKVLTDLTGVLLHPKLLEELFTPQPVGTHGVIKQLLQDISATSIMKLDDYSMNKLWDLMTMIYKWQLAVATTQNIFDITRRHLKTVASLLPPHYPKNYIEYTIKKFDNLGQKFTDSDYVGLRNTMILWFSEYHAKISILIRLGLQRKDGTFSLPSSINPIFLGKLGENIYNHDSKKNEMEEYEQKCPETHEITCLLGSVDSVVSEKISSHVLQLPIQFNEENSKKRTIEITRNTSFESIGTKLKTENSSLSFIPNIPNSTQQELLDMLDHPES